MLLSCRPLEVRLIHQAFAGCDLEAAGAANHEVAFRARGTRASINVLASLALKRTALITASCPLSSATRLSPSSASPFFAVTFGRAAIFQDCERSP